MKKLMLVVILALMLLVLPLALAVQPPDYYSFVETGYGELGIVYPQSLVFRQGQNAIFSFDVTNASDFHINPEVTPINCSFASVSNKGDIQVIQTPHYNNTLDYWQVFFNGSDTKDTGTYGWYLNCNTSIFAGWASYVLFITKTGLSHQNLDTTSGLAITLFMLFLVGLIFALGIKGKFVDGEKTNSFIKLCFLELGLLMLTWTNVIIVNIAEASHLHFADNLFSVMGILNIGVYIGMVVLVLGFGFYFITTYGKQKLDMRMGGEGGHIDQD